MGCWDDDGWLYSISSFVYSTTHLRCNTIFCLKCVLYGVTFLRIPSKPIWESWLYEIYSINFDYGRPSKNWKWFDLTWCSLFGDIIQILFFFRKFGFNWISYFYLFFKLNQFHSIFFKDWVILRMNCNWRD